MVFDAYDLYTYEVIFMYPNNYSIYIDYIDAYDHNDAVSMALEIFGYDIDLMDVKLI